MNRTQQACGGKEVAGALFMGVKYAFNNVSRSHLGRGMEALKIQPDLIRWTGNFTPDRQVKLVLDGKRAEASRVDTGIPHGSPAAPVVFVTKLSRIFDEVQSTLPGVQGLSLVEDVGWWEGGVDDEAAAAASIVWAVINRVAFDHGKPK